MARQIERDLYRALLDSKFSFMRRGVKHIDEIYWAVKDQYQKLCDDSYYCSKHCRSGNEQPEWKHTVRTAIRNLKSKGGSIVSTGRKGFWEFQ
jgi:hypothetical protein